jgi:hypothetical protein
MSSSLESGGVKFAECTGLKVDLGSGVTACKVCFFF